ncbi:hypothetical protein BO78DRAFT_375801 [Aspergillus sclerotiicarbonarius CBS 121057]|uniref:Probable Xaa-Pro aminopeptidase PEPP n=1 Tax=Aspergillus sclerotiicarbonarius (strain CBS 121057 / IBT 28362) TaxID=1448318 RepID=A0A319FAL1_ASPSB|nr:hypothetical protein BO78DRAFT_375801 [Aspergillus sclerotiicarbonarius CBS 121057]
MAINPILRGKYPAKAHAQRVVEYLSAKIPQPNGFLFLSGCPERFYQDCDLQIPFRQHRAFMYLSGVNRPDYHLIYEIGNRRLTLFMPLVDPETIVWDGIPLLPEEALANYDVDTVLPRTALDTTLESIGGRQQGTRPTIFTIPGHVGEGIQFPKEMKVDSIALKEAVDECRVIKDEYEIALLQEAITISSAAHRAVMQVVRTATSEAEIHGVFLGECTKRGAKIQAYPSIVASGRAAATMHPEDNNQSLYIKGTPKEVLLIDAGAEVECYGADVTRTLPISGQFTPKARAIYNIVLKMQEECIASLKAGVLWDDLHLLAHKVAIRGLLELGILKGNPDDILAARTSAAFMPHGLGHFLGMDTHDAGGHANEADPDPLFKYLRVRRHLPAGCVVTIEPGIHFGEHTIREYLSDPRHSQYIDEAVLDRFWDVGGVCIEDDLLVTETGNVNLTDLPKDPELVEQVVSRS